MKEHYPDAKLNEKSLINHEGRVYDVFDLKKKNGESFKLYFDTSIFFSFSGTILLLNLI
jgi:hypothetical protein